MLPRVEVTVNRRAVPLEGAGASLLRFLRESLGLKGAKPGCGEGACGACAVLVEGRPVRACVTPARAVAGASVLTVEGLAADGLLHPVQEAFVEVGAFQCGYCTPGMVMSAVALLRRNPSPTDAEISAALDGNLCRCCAYPRIVRAVRRAGELTGPGRAVSGVARSELPRPSRPWSSVGPEERDYFDVLGDGLVVVARRPESTGWTTCDEAWLHLGTDGSATAFTGKVDVGQGTVDALAALVAEELERTVESVQIVCGDTDVCPYDLGTFASRSAPDVAPLLAAAAAGARRALDEGGGLFGPAGRGGRGGRDAEEPLRPGRPARCDGDRHGHACLPVRRRPARLGHRAPRAAGREPARARGRRARRATCARIRGAAGLGGCGRGVRGRRRESARGGAHYGWTRPTRPRSSRTPRSRPAPRSPSGMATRSRSGPGRSGRSACASSWPRRSDSTQEQIRVIAPTAGGGFGGKHTADAALEAARLAREQCRPVRVHWTREDEFRLGYVRPAAVIDVRAGALDGGTLTAWDFLDINAGAAGLSIPYRVEDVARRASSLPSRRCRRARTARSRRRRTTSRASRTWTSWPGGPAPTRSSSVSACSTTSACARSSRRRPSGPAGTSGRAARPRDRGGDREGRARRHVRRGGPSGGRSRGSSPPSTAAPSSTPTTSRTRSRAQP